MYASRETTFIPRPPPPATALMITGKPISPVMSCASSIVLTGSTVPGRSGRPAFDIRSRAVALSPTFSITSGRGAMKGVPPSGQIFAEDGSSGGEPEPGGGGGGAGFGAGPVQRGEV